MPSVPRPLLVIVAVTALAGGAPMVTVARAQNARQEQPARRGEADPPRGPRMQDNGRSLSDAVRRVQRETGGRILGAERVPYDGRDINRVKYMDDRGRVRYMDDAAPAPRAPRGPRQIELPPRGDNS